MSPFKGTVKYCHIRQDRWPLNTGLIDIKCTMKGNEN
jgi:hypothetical protein